MNNCLVSVIMPVYNVEKYLNAAIDSILNQTYSNIELIIIDDCSTDNSREIIKSYKDDRIRAYYNSENLQQSRTRNKGLKLAKGEYVANMDSDDISCLNRIEEQVKFMDNNIDIDVCGCYIKTFGGNKSRTIKTPLSNDDCKKVSIVTSPVAHPTVIIRRSSLNKYNILYNSDYKYSQDFELWSRLIFEGVKFNNFPKVLLHYRENPTGVTFGHSIESQKYTKKVIARNLKMLFGNCYDFNAIILNDSDSNELKKSINTLLELKNIPNKLDLSEKQIKYIINYLVKSIISEYKDIDFEMFSSLISQIGINNINIFWLMKQILKSYLLGRR